MKQVVVAATDASAAILKQPGINVYNTLASSFTRRTGRMDKRMQYFGIEFHTKDRANQ